MRVLPPDSGESRLVETVAALMGVTMAGCAMSEVGSTRVSGNLVTGTAVAEACDAMV